LLRDEGITIEVHQTNKVINSNVEVGKQKGAQKEGSDHLSVLSCPPWSS
jgi:hypothetical protein